MARPTAQKAATAHRTLVAFDLRAAFDLPCAVTCFDRASESCAGPLVIFDPPYTVIDSNMQRKASLAAMHETLNASAQYDRTAHTRLSSVSFDETQVTHRPEVNN